MLTKNQTLELYIEDMTFEGSGVGRAPDGCVVFVPGTAPGDRISAKIVKAKKNYAYGIAESIIEASSVRGETGCAVYRPCGGCCFRHVTYAEELRVKRNTVAENLKKAGITGVVTEPVTPSPNITGYRNKAQLPVGRTPDGRIAAGFFAKRSHRVVNTAECALHPAFFADITGCVCAFAEKYGISVYDETAHTGLLRHIYIRYGEASGEVMVCLVINGRRLPHADRLISELTALNPDIKSIMLNINTKKTNVILGDGSVLLYGTPYINDTLCGKIFRISPMSFYQVNRSGAERLYNLAFDMAELTGSETVLDLYCGVGTIGLSAADRVKRVIGAEIVPAAVEDAKINAAANGISNAEFICADAAEAARQLESKNIRPDVIFLDPPRKGCSPELIDISAKMSPLKIVMISCSSATMSRDIALFAPKGYELRRVCPVDMFPRTAHVECAALLTRADE